MRYLIVADTFAAGMAWATDHDLNPLGAQCHIVSVPNALRGATLDDTVLVRVRIDGVDHARVRELDAHLDQMCTRAGRRPPTLSESGIID